MPHTTDAKSEGSAAAPRGIRVGLPGSPVGQFEAMLNDAARKSRSKRKLLGGARRRSRR